MHRGAQPLTFVRQRLRFDAEMMFYITFTNC